MNFITQPDFDQITDKVFADLDREYQWTAHQREQFCALANFLLSENEKYNLTAIRTLDGVIKNHFFDSASASVAIPEKAKILDVGTGAGFPSLPLAIVRPDLRIIALDSTEKKVQFVRCAANMLKLPNISAMCGRAEEIIRDKKEILRESFDCVIARSVASLPILSELCLPFVSVGGKFIAMKSESADHEITESKNALKKLGADVNVERLALYSSREGENRCLFVVSKVESNSDIYPRRYAQIKKRPL